MDSSFVIALADEDDQFHVMARRLVNDLRGERVISDLVLSESVAGVSAHLGRKAGSDVFENLFYDSSTRIVYLNKRLCERALHLFLKFGEKLSFADIISVRIMYDRKIKSIISFDSDFDDLDGITRVH